MQLFKHALKSSTTAKYSLILQRRQPLSLKSSSSYIAMEIKTPRPPLLKNQESKKIIELERSYKNPVKRHEMRGYLFLVCLLLFTPPLRSQYDTLYSVEVGLNITNTLAGFFNAGGQQTPLDPYLFSLKLRGKKNYTRLGLNFRVQTSAEFENNGDREVRDLGFYFRAGWEKRKSINKRFSWYWGLDGVLRYENEKVSFANFSGSTFDLREYNTGFGGGPVMGVLYHLNRRISFSTESAVYGIYFTGKKEEDVLLNEPAVSKKIRGFELLPTIPNSLYLIIHF